MDKFNILYVDDEESNLQGFKSIYFRDYNVFTAISGKEALDILEGNEIHIIIADQKMPEMTGVEFLNNVVVRYPDPIRIILTGYSDMEVIIKAINGCGIYRYLTKPWDVEEMNAVLYQGLENYQLRKQNQQLLKDLKQANENLEQKVLERTEEIVKQKVDIQLKQRELQKQAFKLKALNEELSSLNRNLEVKVAKRTMLLEKNNQELELKNRKLEEYAFVNAHNLRSPVATILGLTSLFQNEQLSEEERWEIILKINHSASSLDSVTRKIQKGLEKD